MPRQRSYNLGDKPKQKMRTLLGFRPADLVRVDRRQAHTKHHHSGRQAKAKDADSPRISSCGLGSGSLAAGSVKGTPLRATSQSKRCGLSSDFVLRTWFG